MKNLIKLLFLSMFWFSCESSTEPEGETVELWGVLYSINNTIELDLTSSGLSGEIPIEIGELINLQKLDLKSNSLTGFIPTSLKNLLNLTELNLYNNQLVSEFIDFESYEDTNGDGTWTPGEPYEDANGDGSWTGTEITMSTIITKLTNLNHLTLESNKFSGSIPENINNLTNLISLDLRGNNFTGQLPIEINELLLLENLYLHENDFYGQIDSSICFLSKCYDDNNDCHEDYLGSLDFTSYEYFNIDNNQFCPNLISSLYPECMIKENFDDINNDGEWTAGEPYEDANGDDEYDNDSFGNQDTSNCP